MRKLLGAVLLLAAAGCATNSQIPQDQRTPGKYTLIAVDGQAVPEKLPSGEEVLAGTLVLKADGGFEMKTSLRAQMSSTQPFNFQRQYDGTYTATSIGVNMTWRGGAVTSGAFFGHTLRVFHDGVEYLFLAQ
jgi:hypothetical protein